MENKIEKELYAQLFLEASNQEDSIFFENMNNEEWLKIINEEPSEFFRDVEKDEENIEFYKKYVLQDLNNEFQKNKSYKDENSKIILQFLSPKNLELINDDTRILLEFENVIQDERKYNILDRFFYYSMEETRLINLIKEKLNLDFESTIIQELIEVFKHLKNKLISQIKYSFGLHSFSDYLDSRRTVLFSNPLLLGISPFLFDQMEWENAILSEIKFSSYTKNNFHNFQLMIRNNLRETLFRLDKDEFENLYNWKKEKMSESDLYNLIIDRVFEIIKKSKTPESATEELIEKIKVLNSEKITLTGNFNTGRLIEKLEEGFGKKDIKLTPEIKKDIKSFVSQNFKNSAGKQILFSEIKNKAFFLNHIRLIKHILLSNSKEIKCNNKQISELIHKTFREYFDVKTIENY